VVFYFGTKTHKMNLCASFAFFYVSLFIFQNMVKNGGMGIHIKWYNLSTFFVDTAYNPT
jgi:hypothetical protein